MSPTVLLGPVKMSGVQLMVSFVTDYGWSGGFVGALHAVVDSVGDGRIPVIDVDHCIPAHDVRLGALRIERSCRYLRAGVHVGVVDPGVGSARRGVVVQSGDRRWFVGPDNGLLVPAAEASGGITRAVVIEDESWLLPRRSRTFDGRDVFAPVAARLAIGWEAGQVGTSIEPSELVRLPPAEEGDVLQVDGFGNVQLAGSMPAPGRVVVRHGDRSLPAIVGGTFTDVAVGDGVVLVDSDGCVAVSINQGRASDALGVTAGDRVVIEPEE